MKNKEKKTTGKKVLKYSLIGVGTVLGAAVLAFGVGILSHIRIV